MFNSGNSQQGFGTPFCNDPQAYYCMLMNSQSPSQQVVIEVLKNEVTTLHGEIEAMKRTLNDVMAKVAEKALPDS